FVAHPCRQLNIIMKACIMPLLKRRLPKYPRRRRRQACACGLKIELVCNEKLTNGNVRRIPEAGGNSGPPVYIFKSNMFVSRQTRQLFYRSHRRAR
ncbi:hypothetical protein ACCT30_47400, partial [Rhizobium ruizarguesonis]